MKTQFRLHKNFKLLLLCFFIGILIFAFKDLQIQELIQNYFLEIKNLGIFAPIAFIVIYNLATLLLIPGSVLTLKGGYLFGLFWGSIYVLIAGIIGATLAFLIGRYLSRDWICQKLEQHPKFKAIDLAVSKTGWKIVLLTRLSPIFPFNLLNYAFGVTQVSLKDYILGSFGIIPGTIMYVYMGSLISNITMINTFNPKTQIWQWTMQIIGLIATIFLTIYITKIAQKALTEITQHEN
ncbi:TVP38/TMEM64 family protein [Cronbergia sp. UHCC 0137]|uniref:TVP38/TMEM64 family protein n=1 Tax=Cronbergia sp. UHCC 0137 TaxID=3110239 RepID=UPI002B1EF4C3|nr:TVP38/TMEM64 family protein [Cronbergia sp. UHCC 0137]MEA5619650.1 TVP38/TMEM64 family protein [Cronbergia sp. UHCC 0137]